MKSLKLLETTEDDFSLPNIQDNKHKVMQIALPVLTVLSFYFGSIIPALGEAAQIATFFIVLTAAALLTMDRGIPVGLVFLLFFSVGMVLITGRINLIGISLAPIYFFIAQQINRKIFLAHFRFAMLIGFIAVFMANKFTGWNSESNLVFWRASEGTFIFRDSIGFTHPNQAMITWTLVVLSFLLNQRFKRSRWEILMLSIFSVFIFVTTGSRTGGYILLSVLLIAFLFINQLSRPISSSFRMIAIFSPVILFTASLTILPSLATIPQIDDFLTGRPTIAALLLGNKDALTLFGNINIETTLLDNGPIHLLLSKGLVFAGAFLGLIVFLIQKPRALSLSTALLIFSYVTVSFSETTLLNPIFIIILVLTVAEDERSDFRLVLKNQPKNQDSQKSQSSPEQRVGS
jgi:hypothetical protein